MVPARRLHRAALDLGEPRAAQQGGRAVRRDGSRDLRTPRPPARRTGVIGRSVKRVEDVRFLTGSGRFIDDLEVPGALHCAFVRSPHAHARILSIEANTSVLTGSDMAQDGVGPMRAGWQLPGMVEIPRWALARGTVRYVGEPVAVVFAETRAAAEDAAEQVAVAYEALPLQEQTCFQWTRGDAAAVEQAFAEAAHRVDIELVNNRLCGAAIENRGMAAVPEP